MSSETEHIDPCSPVSGPCPLLPGGTRCGFVPLRLRFGSGTLEHRFNQLRKIIEIRILWAAGAYCPDGSRIAPGVFSCRSRFHMPADGFCSLFHRLQIEPYRYVCRFGDPSQAAAFRMERD